MCDDKTKMSLKTITKNPKIDGYGLSANRIKHIVLNGTYSKRSRSSISSDVLFKEIYQKFIQNDICYSNTVYCQSQSC